MKNKKVTRTSRTDIFNLSSFNPDRGTGNAKQPGSGPFYLLWFHTHGIRHFSTPLTAVENRYTRVVEKCDKSPPAQRFRAAVEKFAGPVAIPNKRIEYFCIGVRLYAALSAQCRLLCDIEC